MALSAAIKNIMSRLFMGTGNAEELISAVDNATAAIGSATAADLVKLHAITATAAELNTNAGVTPGTEAANKTVVADANVNIGAVKATSLAIGVSGSEVAVTTAANLNRTQLQPARFTSINVTTGTLSANDASGAYVTHLTSTNATPGSQAMRTVAQVLADTPGLAVGMSYYLRILNIGAGVFTLATDASTQFTMTGTMTIATANMREFIVTIVSGTTGTVQSLGLTAVTAV